MLFLSGDPAKRRQWIGGPSPPLPSEPDRCFSIKVKHWKWPKMETHTALQFCPQPKTRTKVSVEWEPSPKLGPETGFLDLPKELRDIVYHEICSELKREGLRWKATAPRVHNTDNDEKPNDAKKRPGLTLPCIQDDPVERPAVFADCALMRTCRQLHSEFASTLYANPIQLSGIDVGHNEIPLSLRYASLVRTVLHVGMILQDLACEKAWRLQLEIASALFRMFPNLDVMRLGWLAAYSVTHAGPISLRLDDPSTCGPAVKGVEECVRRVKSKFGSQLIVPPNLEVVQVQKTRRGNVRYPPNQYIEVLSVLTPVTEAISNLRSELPLGRVLRPRRMQNRCSYTMVAALKPVPNRARSLPNADAY